MSPNSQTNLAAKDVMTALNFLQKVLPSFGGSSSKITLAGQSSGANMIRGLLAIPSAQLLFQSAILQSDTMVGLLPFEPTAGELTRLLGLRLPF